MTSNSSAASRAARNDRISALLLLVEWTAAVVLALIISPRTWDGEQSSIHPHVYQALWIGLMVGGLPAAIGWFRQGRPWVKFVIACAQASMPSLFVHITGGRIETHFFYFGSLAALVVYRDWRVIVSATVVIAGDHVIRGLWFPLSIFGSAQGNLTRIVEHAWWVVFEDIFLIRACLTGSAEWDRIEKQATLLAQELEESRVRATTLESAAIGLTELSSTLESAATASLSESDQSLERSEQMAMDLKEAASAAETMTAQSRELNELASNSVSVAAQSVAAAQTAEQELATLGKATSEIGEIISAIQYLTFQINLLAINANIEAARAGESGRGFAVVASEVRRLAHESAGSAGSIRAKLEKISSHSAKGATAISQTASLVRALATCAEASNQTAVAQTQLVDDVHGRCTRAWQTSAETAKSMYTLSLAASSTRDSAKQTSTSANSLRELATGMASQR